MIYGAFLARVVLNAQCASCILPLPFSTRVVSTFIIVTSRLHASSLLTSGMCAAFVLYGARCLFPRTREEA